MKKVFSSVSALTFKWYVIYHVPSQIGVNCSKAIEEILPSGKRNGKHTLQKQANLIMLSLETVLQVKPCYNEVIYNRHTAK